MKSQRVCFGRPQGRGNSGALTVLPGVVAERSHRRDQLRLGRTGGLATIPPAQDGADQVRHLWQMSRHKCPRLADMSRPRLSPKQRKRNVFSIRLTDAELGQIESLAKKAGLEPKTWAKNRLRKTS
jgi:hypothetical protein